MLVYELPVEWLCIWPGYADQPVDCGDCHCPGGCCDRIRGGGALWKGRRGPNSTDCSPEYTSGAGVYAGGSSSVRGSLGAGGAAVSTVMVGVPLCDSEVDCGDRVWPLRACAVGSSGPSLSESLSESFDGLGGGLGDAGRFRKGLLGADGVSRASVAAMGCKGRNVRGKFSI